ncbi:flagellar hook-basal body protein [Sphingorhabdus arenilitoris]|uniref:Flagellar hook-basal body protein n=1 Tax=Sphingorhabdus arenilitoris TaxID=1490041 RepID=A0ABV8RCJ5_9SPHN
MGYIVDLAAVILGQSERRAETIAQNLSNSVTPGFKRSIPFSSLVDRAAISSQDASNISVATDTRPGKLVKTGNPVDMAISGSGYFAVSKDGVIGYTRDGRFSLAEDGSLINSQGGTLQGEDGADITILSSTFSVKEDGVIYENGIRTAKIGIFNPLRDQNQLSNNAAVGQFAASDPKEYTVQQGWYEASNVTSGDEMVMLMETLRRAESGQRIMNVYDDLMGRAISAFGESGR